MSINVAVVGTAQSGKNKNISMSFDVTVSPQQAMTDNAIFLTVYSMGIMSKYILTKMSLTFLIQ